MGLVFLLVGGGWALLGVATFVLTAHTGLSENWTAFNAILTAVPFVLPGLILASVGAVLRSRQRARRAVPVPAQHVSASARLGRKRLAELDWAFFSKKISLTEYRQRRQTLMGKRGPGGCHEGRAAHEASEPQNRL